ncbi:MAG: hypothetical protein E5Y73_08460 [Mesorhizobium sp.]|uniref:hypothetical protein n=1 Tax=Mesorhizobium sp. TaxID=1871066 RepID=UPI0012110962|nr:hypothetical protein [Mesorhizobium sp.]TIL95155.1 MAG: hypothetical protein E5Y73_08460 [Mesorhizobium sp.]
MKLVAKLKLGEEVALAFAAADDPPRLGDGPRCNGFTREARIRGEHFMRWMIVFLQRVATLSISRTDRIVPRGKSVAEYLLTKNLLSAQRYGNRIHIA